MECEKAPGKRKEHVEKAVHVGWGAEARLEFTGVCLYCGTDLQGLVKVVSRVSVEH